jgi:hypothetical protein
VEVSSDDVSAGGVVHFTLGSTCARVLARGCQSTDGESMELLELMPPEFGVAEAGVYVIDDDGTGIYAGPFDDDAAALGWIEQRQLKLSRGLSDRADVC